MYCWFGVEGSVLNFFELEIIVGSFELGIVDYGLLVSDVFIIVEVVQVFDVLGVFNLVCEVVVNVDEVNGKIVLIDCGDCFFEEKIINVEVVGVVVVIICNYLEEVLGMVGGVDGIDLGIFIVSMKVFDCQQIKNVLVMGEIVIVIIVLLEDSGFESVGFSMDNGVIVYEYGYGISNCLMGGFVNSDCLFNDE